MNESMTIKKIDIDFIANYGEDFAISMTYYRYPYPYKTSACGIA